MSARRTGLAIVGLFLLVVLLAPQLGRHPPTARVGRPFARPSSDHWLGTNDLGHDLWSQLVHGSRITIGLGLAAGGLTTAVGTAAGLFMAHGPRILRQGLRLLTNVVLGIPVLPLVIVLAAFGGGGMLTVLLVIALVRWPSVARVVHARTLAVLGEEYIGAARSLGATEWWVLRRHVLPALGETAGAQLLLAINAAALTEAGLSFLGLGDPTVPSWGTILHFAQARSAFLGPAWSWWALPPGLALSLFLIGVALLRHR